MRQGTRWINIRDIPDLIQIDRQSLSVPWSAERLHAVLDTPAVTGIVATQKPSIEIRPWTTGKKSPPCPELVIGYLLYKVAGDVANVLGLAVLGDCRRTGVGTTLLLSLKDYSVYSKIVICVEYDNFVAIQFLQHNRFVIARQLKASFRGPMVDACELVCESR